MEGIIISVVAGFITGYIGMYVAKEKNRSGSEGFWFGFLLKIFIKINLEPKLLD